MQALLKFKDLLAQGKCYEFALKAKTIASRKAALGQPSVACTILSAATSMLGKASAVPEALDLAREAIGVGKAAGEPWFKGFVGVLLQTIKLSPNCGEKVELCRDLSEACKHEDKEVLRQLVEFMAEAGQFNQALPYLPRCRDVALSLGFLKNWQAKLGPEEKELAVLKVGLAMFGAGTDTVAELVGGMPESAMRRLLGLALQCDRLDSPACWRRVEQCYGAVLQCDPGLKSLWAGAGQLLFK